jgi:hypothetical protein
LQQIFRRGRLCLDSQRRGAARRQQHRRDVIIAWPDRTKLPLTWSAARIRHDGGARRDQQCLVRRHSCGSDKLHRPSEPPRHFASPLFGKRTGSLQRGYRLHRQGAAEDAQPGVFRLGQLRAAWRENQRNPAHRLRLPVLRGRRRWAGHARNQRQQEKERRET